MKSLRHALWLLLIPYAYCVWIYSPSNSQHQPDCAEYADSISGYSVVTAATDDTAEHNQTKYDDKVKREKALECSDFHAQWAMADVTFWAFGAGIAGIFLVFLTWLATRVAANVSREIGQATTRAYIGVTAVSVTDINAPLGAVVSVSVNNFGASPATDCTVEVVLSISKMGPTPPLPEALGLYRDKATGLTFAPGGRDNYVRIHARSDDKKTPSITDRIFIIGEVTVSWTDVFGQRHASHTTISNADIAYKGTIYPIILSITDSSKRLMTVKPSKP